MIIIRSTEILIEYIVTLFGKIGVSNGITLTSTFLIESFIFSHANPGSCVNWFTLTTDVIVDEIFLLKYFYEMFLIFVKL